MDLKPHIEKFRQRFAELETLLSDPKTFANTTKSQELAREYARLKQLVADGQAYLRIEHDLSENRADGLLLGRVDEAAGVHDDDARFLRIEKRQPLPLQMAQHHLGVDEVLGASERHDADGREGKRKRIFHRK